MSGIAAVFHFDGSAVPQHEIERVGNVLKPYGPDRQKILTRGSAAFAFCLHRLTPEDNLERQPLLLANRFVLLFDGRIDNREELGDSLGVPASELRTLPDGAIALGLFDRCGAGGFERILGDWAIIVVDLQERRVLCVRDPMGLRVLHYHHSPQRFAVATVPEALFALSWVPRILNKDKVGDTLVQRGLNGETTYYQQIYRVMPGFTITVSDKGLRKDRFWNPENIPTIRLKRDEDYVEALREILKHRGEGAAAQLAHPVRPNNRRARLVEHFRDRGRHAWREWKEAEYVHGGAGIWVLQGGVTWRLLRRDAVRSANSGSQF